MVTIFYRCDEVRHDMFCLDTTAQNRLDKILQKEKDLVREHNWTYKYQFWQQYLSVRFVFWALSSWHSQRLFVSAGLCRMILKKKNAPCWQTDKAFEDRRTCAEENPSILCINQDLHMGWTYSRLACMSVKLQQSGHTVHIQPDTQLFACAHAWNSHRQLCLELQTSVILYFLQALWSCIMQSLPHDKDAQPWGSYTDLLFPRQNKCHTSLTLQMPHEKYEPGSKQLAEKLHLHHMYCKSVQTTALSSANNPELTKSVRGQVHTYADKHVPPQRHTENEAFCCWCEILDCLCLFPLCFCALRYFLVPQFYELLCCSQKHKRQRLKDELEARGRMKSNI